MPYTFSADTDRIDRARVHAWLRDQSYWASDRPRTKQDAAIDASRNYGLYDDATGEQVAYARVVTDGETFAWLCDVFVSPTRRGEGLGKQLVAGVLADLDPRGLNRIALGTRDAHGLYAQFGFEPADASRDMVRRSPA